jgi:hypothetical protein
MLGQTIAERFCQTKDLAARRILQDEAAMVGAQGIIDQRLAARLARAEAKVPECEPAMQVEQNVICEHFDSKPTRTEMNDLRRTKQTNQLEWLRGRASVRVVEEDQDDIQRRLRPW